MNWIGKILLIGILAAAPASGWAFNHEPLGFRDLEFGESLTDILKTHHVQADGIDRLSNSKKYLIVMPAKDMHFRDISIGTNAVLGTFWKGQLHTLQIVFPAATKEERDTLYDELLGVLAVRFGSYGDVRNDKGADEESVFWFGTKTNAEIKKVNEPGKGTAPESYGVEIMFRDQLLHKQAEDDAASQDF